MKVNTDIVELKAAEQGMNLTQLAQEAGISRATLTTIKKNKNCTGQTFLKIAKALKVKPEELLLREE